VKLWDVKLPTFRPCKVYDDAGAEVRAVFRVEFDGDGDEGMATVSRYEADANGAVVLRDVLTSGVVDAKKMIGPQVGKVVAVPAVITERRWVRVVPKVFNQTEADTPVEVRS